MRYSAPQLQVLVGHETRISLRNAAENMTSYDAVIGHIVMPMSKFMLSVGLENFRLLENAAEQRGISVQELLRAVIIPDWVRKASSEIIKPYVGPLQFASTIHERTSGRPPRA